MKLRTLALLFTACLTLPFAASAQDAAIRKALEERLGKDFKVDGVSNSPIKGVFEVRVGTDIFYVDEKAQNIIIGQIQDLKTGQNFTQEKIDKLATQAVFNPDNLKGALKQVRGNGKRQLVLFEDVNCGYCKKLRAEMEKLTDVTIYTYLIPILSPDSATKQAGIWCSSNKNKAYDDWMLRGVTPAAADSRCATPSDANKQLAQNLKVNGTPAIFFESGKRIPGYVELAQLEQALSAKP